MSERVTWGNLSARERDALVAERVMGWVKDGGRRGFWFDPADPKLFYASGYTHDGSDYDFPDFCPTTDIAAAWEVVEKLVELGMYPDLISTGDPVAWRCVVDKYIEDVDTDEALEWPRSAVAATAPEAICIAALRAVGVEVDQ